MARLGRLGACLLIASTPLVVGLAPSAQADHCRPIANPSPIPGENREWCHTARPTPAPPTPVPTPPPPPPPAPEPEPTAAPTPAPAARTPAPARTPGPDATPAGTPFQIEVPTDPLATPQIVVEGPIDDATDFDVGQAEQTSAASNWIFGFIVGFIIGGLAGRASWGLRRRRRQQIFG